MAQHKKMRNLIENLFFCGGGMSKDEYSTILSFTPNAVHLHVLHFYLAAFADQLSSFSVFIIIIRFFCRLHIFSSATLKRRERFRE